ncbi:MAG: hypothetical protein OHK93_000010 [Ramalina farinacea]|uniref:Uncharacterized protein n=1 Tax=Ramalina farinacea TaxID=258253 RepID=A0AA43TN09_9LECA|nr:hypothetical protein [Ramalina farinacea]
MAVHDQCGPLGQNKAGVFIAVPPGQLSTSKVGLRPPMRDVGDEWLDPSVYGQGFFAQDNIQPFVAADMNCPTFGLGVSTNSQGVVRTTIGSPWLPLIVPPSEALSLDTAWLKYCTGILSYSQDLASFGIFDPPHALVPDPAGGLVGPSESQPTPAVDPEETRIQPGQSPTAATPSATPLWKAPVNNLIFAPLGKLPAAGLLAPTSTTSEAVPSQAGAAVPASRQDTNPQDNTNPVKNPSENGISAGDQPGNPSGLAGQPVSTPSNNDVNSGNSPSDTTEGGPQPQDPSNSQQPADTAQGSGVNGFLGSNNSVDPQQNQDPATNPIKNPSGEPNEAISIVQGSNPHSTPSASGNGDGSQAGVNGMSPAGSPIDGEGSNQDVSSVQQGGQGVEQPADGGQVGPQGTTSPGPNGPGMATQSSNNMGTIQQGSGNQLTSPQNGNINQAGSLPGVGGALPVNPPVNDPGSNQMGSPAQQVNQDAGQQDLGAQTNAQGITPVGTDGEEAVPQGSSSKNSLQQVSDGQVMTPQDSSGSNGGLQLSEQAIQPFNADDTSPVAQAVAVAGQTFSPDPNGFEVAGQAVKPGDPGVVVSGTPISLAPSGTLIVGGSVIPLLNPAPQVQPLRVGGESFIPKPEGFDVGGALVQPGGPAITVAGTPISLAPLGTPSLGDSTIQLVQAVPTQAAQHRQLLNVGGQSFVPNPTGFVVAGHSVKPGGPAIKIAGTPVSLAQNSALFVGSSIIPLDTADAGPVTSTAPQNVVYIGGEPVVAFPTGLAIPGVSNIIPGGPPVTVASTPVSLGSDGILHVGASAIPLSPPGRQVNEQNQAKFNVGSFTFTLVAPSATNLAVEGTTILPNSPPQIIHGTTVSLDANNDLTVNGTHMTIPTGTNNNVFNVGNLTFTAITPPAGVSVDGVRILPGETALNLRGKNITVDANGGLAVGDMAVPIPKYSSDGSVLQVGNLTFSALSRGGGVVVDGITILPNATSKLIHGVGVKLDASGDLMIGNVSMAAPTRLAAATGPGDMVASTGGAAQSGGIITANVVASTSGTATSSEGAGPMSISTDSGRPDGGNAAPMLRLPWAWMVVAFLLGNFAFFVL